MCRLKISPLPRTHSNVTISFNILRASAEHGITRVCQLSSINSTGSSFHPYHRNYKYFPIDEKIPGEVADTYALSKQASGIQTVKRGHIG